MANTTEEGPGPLRNVLILVAGVVLGLVVGQMITSVLGMTGFLVIAVPIVTTVVSVVIVLLLYNRVFLS